MRHIFIGFAIVAGCAQLRPAAEPSQLVGIWESAGGFEYSRMTIMGGGRVDWLSIGCLDEVSGRSSALDLNGTLTLSVPLQAYGGDERRVFHYFRDHGREYLVPEEHLEFVREESSPFGTDHWWGLRRRLPKLVLEERLAASIDEEERTYLLAEWASWSIDQKGIELLGRLARDDPSEDVRREAAFALEQTGKDDLGDVRDRSLHDAAQAVLTQLSARNAQATGR